MGLPARSRFGAGLSEMDLAVHMIDPGQRKEMVLSARVRIVLGEFHLVPAFHLVDGTDVDAVAADDLHVILDHDRCDHLRPPFSKRITQSRWPEFQAGSKAP